MNKMIQFYRKIFQKHPEIGWMTWFSTVYIAKHLEDLGYRLMVGKEIFEGIELMDYPSENEIQKAKEAARRELSSYFNKEEIDVWMNRMGDYTGALAFIGETQVNGEPLLPYKAFRFDMDALCVSEKGAFHACGHDGHMALGLALAHHIADNKDKLNSPCLLIFQPAEEGVRGAVGIRDAWEKKQLGKIKELYCCHIGFAPENCFVAGAEGFLATSKFDVTFHGRSAHAGLAPQRGRNALLAAARATVLMEELRGPEGKLTRLNVGQLRAGESRNTIAANAWMQIETRGQDAELDEYMKNQALACIELSARQYGVTYEVEYKGKSVSAVSSLELRRHVHRLVQEMIESGEEDFFEKSLESWKFGASDDGAVLMDYVQKSGGQAIYMLFGCKLQAMHHEVDFDYDEQVLEWAYKLYKKIMGLSQ